MAVGGPMVLQRVIRQVLLALGEHGAVDLRVGSLAHQGHVLIDFCQPAAQGGDGPLQAAIALDLAALVGEVPDSGRPVLQVDVAQPGARLDDQFDAPQVQARCVGLGAGGLGQHGGLGAVFQHDQGVAQVGCAGRERREHVQRAIDRDPARHVQHRAPRPPGGMQRRELVGRRIDHPGLQVRLEQIAVLDQRIFQAVEHHALPREPCVQPRADRMTVERQGLAGQIHAPGQQTLGRRHAGRRLGQKAEPVQPQQTDVGPHPLFFAAAGQRQLLKRLPGVQPHLANPGRLAARRQKRVERFLAETENCAGLTHEQKNSIKKTGGLGAVERAAAAWGAMFGGDRSDESPAWQRLSRPCLPSATRSAGSFPRRIPSAAL